MVTEDAVQMASLRNCAPGTFGHAYADFMDSRGFTPGESNKLLRVLPPVETDDYACGLPAFKDACDIMLLLLQQLLL